MNLTRLLRSIAAAVLLLFVLLPLSANAITLVQQKFATVKTTTTTQTLTVTLTSPATIGNTLAVGFSAIAASGTQTLTSIQDNNGTNFTVLQNNGPTGFSGPTGNAVLAGLTNASTSVTIVVGNTASALFSVDIIVYELSGNLTADVTGAHATTTSSTTLTAAYTTAAANEFAWAANGTNNSGVTVTPTNGWTIDDQPSVGNTAAFFAHINPAPTGATNFGATFGSATVNQWNIATLNTGGAPAPAPKMMLMGVSKLIHHKPAANDSTFTHKRAA